MKKTLRFVPVLLLVFSFSGPKAAIEWTFTDYDFGTIDKGKPVTVDFEFKNPGMVPLVIANVKSSCGCTVPEYSKQPIAPGATGMVKVTYDAKMSGHFSKTITVSTNTDDGVTLLYIKGIVQ